PALAIDTSCSSSLVAIHAACKDLRDGEAEMALAGGVFVQATSKLYLSAGRAGMLSPNGRCHTFDSRADGFVPGEGLGILVLKRLSRALADGDFVHGVIVGSGTNHDGTTNGITAPSAASQEALLRRVHDEFSIDPLDIDMVEAHGTGTQLGDPIEYRALLGAFGKQGRCALGSIKTNIGHTQFAAGVAGVIKVIEALRHQVIPPSLNFDRANPAIDLTRGPFFVPNAAEPWPHTAGHRRLGAVSSFGASGTNAHVILEEAPDPVPGVYPNPEHLVVLSARRASQLRTLAERLLAHVQTHPDISCGDIAWTLAIGRKSFEHRLALVATNLNELVDGLAAWLNGTGEAMSAEVRPGGAVDRSLYDALEQATSSAQRRDALTELGGAFVSGGKVDARRIYRNAQPRRVALPTMPFADTRYWLPEGIMPETAVLKSATSHPGLKLEAQGQGRWRIHLAPDLDLLTDHQVRGHAVLPGMAVLEVLHQALGTLPLVRDLTWLRPLEATTKEAGDLLLTLKPAGQGAFDFSITRGEMLFSQGRVVAPENPVPAIVEASRLSKLSALPQRSSESCYDAIRAMGIVHGPRLQALRGVHLGDGEALAALALPFDDGSSPVPSAIFDAALQAAIAFVPNQGNGETPVPFSIATFTVFDDCRKAAWALLTAPSIDGSGALSRLDIDILAADGRRLARMEGCVSRLMPHPSRVTLLKPVWEPVTVETTVRNVGKAVVIGATAQQQESLRAAWPDLHAIQVLADTDDDALADALQALGQIEEIIVVADGGAIALNDDAMIHKQDQFTVGALHLLRAVLKAGYEAKALRWTVLTVQALSVHAQDVPRPAAAGLPGLFGALTKEYPHWSVLMVDLPQSCASWPVSVLAGLPADNRGSGLALRQGSWLRPSLVPLQVESVDATPYRDGGVYVVIGGAGGIGRVWTQAIAREHGARVVWLGRRPADAAIERALDEIGQSGPRPIYLQCDATDLTALTVSRDVILERFGRIDGIVQSAISLNDGTLARMQDQTMRKALAPKVDVCVRLAQVFDLAAMDFVLFFSSIQSFSRMPGQGNYAAGCTFMDAYASALSRTLGVSARVMSWGYWGDVGIVATDDYRTRMAGAGLDSITPDEGMKGLKALLNSELGQAALVKLTSRGSVESMRHDVVLTPVSGVCPSVVETVVDALAPQEARVEAITDRVGNQMSDLDSEMARILWVQMLAVGLFSETTWRRDDIAARVAPLFGGPWLDETLRVLVRYGYLSDDGRVLADREKADADAAWADWNRAVAPLREHPDRRAHLTLAETMLRGLPNILAGRCSATDIMFPKSSLALVEPVYRDNVVADYFNEILCDTLEAAVRERLRLEPKARLRLMEVGAGTGGTAVRVFERLKPYADHIDEYCYTDLSKAFLLHAQRNYAADAPYLVTRIFNADSPVDEQGIDAGTYDMVIATNVLHATRDIRASLRHVKGALKRNGMLFLNELTDNVLFSHLTFGLLPGWWAYEDGAWRIEGSPALTTDSWSAVLHAEGYGRVQLPAKAALGLGQQIIVCESDGLIFKETSAEPMPLSSGALRERGAESERVAAPMPTASFTPKVTEPSSGELRELTRRHLRTLIGEAIAVAPDEIGFAAPLERYGVDSILVLQIVARLRDDFPEVSSTLLFEHNTVDALTDHFLSQSPDRVRAAIGGEAASPSVKAATALRYVTPLAHEEGTAPAGQNEQAREIAIVGMSGRYPGARDLSSFWDVLANARDCVSEVPVERWDWRDHFDPRAGVEGKSVSRWAGFVDGIDHFDPMLFHISPAEAERMDPQERLFLQEAWSSLEEAGYDPKLFGSNRKVGVFVGVMNAHYATRAAFWSVANRVSYLLNLKGPSLAVDTACSSSLTAVHLAVESLRAGRCEAAIVGGVNLITHPRHMATLSELGILSPSGRCRSFADGADGIANGEGVGAVVLKPLDQARADGDHIHGVIVGSAVNSGGRTSSYTAPSPAAHAALIRDALDDAGLDAGNVDYIEAHGTGTALGDPVEVEGLSRVFLEDGVAQGRCFIGSVKSNIGHLESAAGVASMTKVMLQMAHGKIVPTLHADKPNPHIDFTRTPFTLATEARDWPSRDGRPRTAGVSSFGAGGANAHVLLREAPIYEDDRGAAPMPVLFVLSARTQEALVQQAIRIFAHMEAEPPTGNTLADIAYT
ncbi:MAG TPA: SDR family NAD(P)-dependent oxidoreductase, partial [Magnetovibrio sp.]